MSLQWFRRFNYFSRFTFTVLNTQPLEGQTITIKLYKEGLLFDEKTFNNTISVSSVVFEKLPYGEYDYIMSGNNGVINQTGALIIQSTLSMLQLTYVFGGKFNFLITENLNPFQGAKINIYLKHGSVFQQTLYSSASGLASSRQLPNGEYMIYISHANKVTVTQDVSINSADQTITAAIVPAGLLKFMVACTNTCLAIPLAHYRIVLSEVDVFSGNADENGIVEVPNMPFYTYLIYTTAQGFEAGELEVVIDKVEQTTAVVLMIVAE